MTKFHPDVAFPIISAASGILMEHYGVSVRARSVGPVMTFSKIMRFFIYGGGQIAHEVTPPRCLCSAGHRNDKPLLKTAQSGLVRTV